MTAHTMNDRTFRAGDAHKLEDPERLVWLPPADVLSVLQLTQGMSIADVGTGTGYFALPMAGAIGERGRLFAVDLQEEMLIKLRAKLSKPDAPKNISLVEGDAARTTLPGGSCDLVFLANLWHELDDHPAVLAEAKRVIRPGGKIAILDWRADMNSPPGPPVHHRVPLDEVSRTLSGNGWSVQRSMNIGAYSYLLIAMSMNA